MPLNKGTKIESIDLESEGNKYICNIQIIKEALNIFININS